METNERPLDWSGLVRGLNFSKWLGPFCYRYWLSRMGDWDGQ